MTCCAYCILLPPCRTLTTDGQIDRKAPQNPALSHSQTNSSAMLKDTRHNIPFLSVRHSALTFSVLSQQRLNFYRSSSDKRIQHFDDQNKTLRTSRVVIEILRLLSASNIDAGGCIMGHPMSYIRKQPRRFTSRDYHGGA